VVERSGPLVGVRVIELAGLGPAPFASMVLADLGADVVVVDRVAEVRDDPPEQHQGNVYRRGRRSIAVDLKAPEGAATVRRLAGAADVFVEGFRPGVAERLGLGPGVLLGDNPGLVYGRMTGWGQDGPLAHTAGHDINYLAIAGPLAHIGRAGAPPTPPLNLVGDFGGGGMLLALGVCAALVERARSGRGQVIDAAMVDGAALLLAPIYAAHGTGFWHDERGTNLLDGGAPWYDSYVCADGRWIAVGAIEPQFYTALLAGLGLDGEDLPAQSDEAGWPVLRERFTAVFATRTRDEWLAVFEGTDACVAPVRTMGECADDPHLAARGTYVESFGHVQAAPAPRFDRTPGALTLPPPAPGQHTDEVLREAGFDAAEIAALRSSGVVA
jgi:alpha-methylacyl-CoA racemase